MRQGTLSAPHWHFFLGADAPKPDPETYTAIVKKTALMVEAVESVSPGEIVQELSSKFSKAQILKRKLDDIRQLFQNRKINASEYRDKLDEL